MGLVIRAHDEQTIFCASFGKYGCTAWVPITNHYDDEYSLELRNGDDEGWREVSEQTFDRCKDDAWCNTEADE